MKHDQLKNLIKHIISEVSIQSEMIANKDVGPDVMGAVNVEGTKKQRICFHCKKPRPCPCDQYDDENRDASDPESPKFDSKRFGMKSERDPFTGKLKFEEGFFDGGDAKNIAQKIWGNIKKVAKISHPSSNATFFSVYLNNGDLKILRKDNSGKWFHFNDNEKKYIAIPDVNEQSASGAAGAYSTPFAFAPSKKKKKVKENNLKNEKTTYDGRYVDDMEDGNRSNRISRLNEGFFDKLKNAFQTLRLSTKYGLTEKDVETLLTYVDIDSLGPEVANILRSNLKDAARKGYIKNVSDLRNFMKISYPSSNVNEMTTSGAVGQPGGMIQTPAWGTKNKLGSPKGIKGSEKLGYKVVKSITNEGK